MSETAAAAAPPAPSGRHPRPASVASRPTCPAPGAVRRRAAALTGALAALGSLATLWAARLQVTGEGVYVSQLGADGMPTAPAFNAALLVLAAGGALVGWALRGHRARVRVLGAWSTGTTLLVAGLAFAVASQVTCTAGCPVPLTPGAGAQDLGHTTAAVVGFGAAAWAMLQVGWSGSARSLRLVSRGAAAVVAGAAAAGGLLSVAGLGTDVGAGLEHLATTVAVLWLAVLAGHAAVRRTSPMP
ncbi:DUF998 domain-containing protein [Pseudokineococcus lusitanus]|uniref:DUF998 domain-containing protein n=1 Tax=Pseudokineococcus lusitanus TaxID=763993 RepID=A0A3N1GA74_9ACTN|nr:DUF998 domain-containing protein [Pseudokineococcus lusitanus]ROP27133.1 hypothetical protein EDC03_2656 [Pseudokineococcus lusitanus]